MNNFFGNAAARFEAIVLPLLLGPAECIRCGRPVPGAIPLCDNCRGILENYVSLNSPERCAACGRPLLSEKTVCMECRERSGESSLDRLYPLHTYRVWKKDLAFAWKTEGQRRLSPLFAALLFKALKELGKERCPLVPVPPRQGKIKEKGWDQVDELSGILRKKYGVSVTRLLVRKSGREQKMLSRSERLGTSGAVYDLQPEIKEIPSEVVLLDDIVTTGATMERCAWLLKKVGVRKVYGLSLFIVD